jgi:predicted amidohydrolase YtcJ
LKWSTEEGIAMRRALVILIVATMAATGLGAPATAGKPEPPPHVGQWESFDSLDGSYQTLSIAGRRILRLVLRDSGATACGTDELGTPTHAAIARGTGRVAGDAVSTRLRVRCVGRPRPNIGAVASVFTYDPATDTLTDSFDPATTWTRLDPAADPLTIYRDATVLTMDKQQPTADAVATRRGIIVAVGSDRQIGVLTEKTSRVLDLDGRTVLPGFIDSHAHWLGDRELAGWATPEEAIAAALADGWTSISELFVNQDRLDELVILDSTDALPIRVNAYLPVNYHDDHFGVWFTDYEPRQEYSARLRIAGVKAFVDRSSPEMMFLSEEHSNQPGYYGHASWTAADLTAMVGTLHADGWQVAIHTSGDAAHDMVLDAFAAALAGDSNDGYRHRIEHVMVVRGDQVNRMRDLGIIASIQLPWFNSDWLADAFWGTIDDALGPDRLPWVGRWRDLLNAGVPMIGGTDTPWTPASSMKALHEAVTRVGEFGATPAPWMLDQRITVEEALRLITIDAAYGTFDEEAKGSIAPGKYADLVILSDSPLDVAVADLPDIEVLATVVDGQGVFCAAALPSPCS